MQRIQDVIQSGKTRRDLLLGFGSQLAYKALGFAVLALMARQLPQADYGKLMFALTLCAVTVLATDLGASTDLVRRIAARPAAARRRLGSLISARLPLVGAYLLLLSAWVALTKPDALAVVAAIAVYAVLKELYRSHASLFFGLGRIEYTIAAFGTKLLFLVTAVAVGVLAGGGLAWMTGAHLASGVVLLAVAAAIRRARVGRIRLRPRLRSMRRVFGSSIWLFALSAMSIVHFGADTLMLGYMRPYDQVAVYEAAARLLEASQFLVRPLALVLFPVCAVLASTGRWDELRRLMHRMFTALAGLGLAACAAAAVLALPVIRVVYTELYADSAAVLRVLFLSLPGLYVATIGVFVASSMHRERRAASILAAGLAMNVGLNLWAIPRYGPLGAAWVTAFSQTCIACALAADAYRGVASRRAGADDPGHDARIPAGVDLSTD